MAQQVVTKNGTVTVPGPYGTATVVSSPKGFGVTGILMILGESDRGPRFSDETSLGLNAYGPDQDAAIRAKYGTGRLVDACLGAAEAARDPQITASFQRVIPIKLNRALYATATLSAIPSGTYGVLTDRSGGTPGNLISFTSAVSTAESLPTTGSLVVAPPQVSTTAEFRVNGGAAVQTVITAGTLPSAIVSAINALSGPAATGGASRSTVTAVAGTLTVVVDSGFQAHFNISTAWANPPVVGDTMYVPVGSPMAAANEGTWVVTATSASRIDAYKLLDAAGAGSVRTAPTGEGPISIAATTDLQCFSPAVITIEAGAVSPGLGKSLEIANNGSGLFSTTAFKFAGATASPPAAAYTGISISGTPSIITSAAEHGSKLTVSRATDGVNDVITTEGAVVMTIGYTGTTGTAVIAGTTLTTTVVGGAGASVVVDLTQYPTVLDLCTWFNSQPGYTAAPATAAKGQTSPLLLDAGSYTMATSWGAKTARIKADGAAYLAAVNAGSSLVTVAPVAPATRLTGLPDVKTLTFLSGGSRGSVSDTDILDALGALEKCRGNFVVVTLDSDATADIAAGVTDAASTYTIAAAAANLTAHVIKMSGFKRRRPRQGFIGFKGTFAASKEFSANIASKDVAVAFQSCRTTNSVGSIVSAGPWMMGVKAAGMQAAAGAKSLVDKFINVSSVFQATADFDDQSDTDLENALTAGLLIATRDEAGGYRWVCDQTTWVRDDNFVFNSVGNVYNLNVLLQGLMVRTQKSFNGKTTAEVTAAQALGVMERYFGDAFAAGLLAPSTEAPLGFTKAKVRISAPAIYFSARVVLATGILFEITDLEVVPAESAAG